VVGKLIGQYRIVGILGAGAMGTVYVGEHTLIHRRAAIKVLRRELFRGRESIEQFFTEARAATAINNAGIVQIFDFGFTQDGAAYIVMELLEGETLTSWLRSDGPMRAADVLRVLSQVASSLAAAHAAGILHRDLRPDNLFVVRDPEVAGELRAKILGFGIAKLGDVFAVPGTVTGTLLYTAPEQFEGSADERSDIYALGCVLFEALVGEPPFSASTAQALIVAHARAQPASPSIEQPSLPAELDPLVLKCLAKDPAARFPSMAALAHALEAALAGIPQAALVGAPKEASGGSSPAQRAEASPRGAPAANVQPGAAAPSVPAPAPAAPAAPAAKQDERDEEYEPSPTELLRRLAGAGDDKLVHDAFAGAFDTVIPPGFRDQSTYLVEFFRELFKTASQLEGRLIQLGTPVIRDLDSRNHYVLFLHDVENDATTPFGQIGTRAFRAQVDPFAKQLAKLQAPAGSVLITVLAAPQLGQGARETIFALRTERNLFVVPIAASEIRQACEAGTTRLLLINRIADLHTVSDPFAIFEGFTDPTCFVGFSAEVADLVKYIGEGGKIISVAGPPGSGKTSMVAMAEYGCDTSNVARQFVRIQCGELPDHEPGRLIQEICARVRRLRGDREVAPDGRDATQPAPPASAAVPDLRATILQLGAQRAFQTMRGVTPHRARHETGLAKRHQLVIVLEDADWLIRLASSSEPNVEQRGAARELWVGLAQLCSSGAHTVIVTSIRDFQVMDQVPLEQPITVSRVPMRALSRRESDHLVTSLGELVGFRPTRRAFAKLYDESGGNVYALRLLCSDVIRATRERPNYSPLASLTVTPRLVAKAVEHIEATGSTFRSHVSLWLDEVEKNVLQYIAKERPRSPQAIRRALEAIATPAQISRALDALELMGIVDHRRGHHRVCIPLFERWINSHLDAPRSRRYAIQQQRLSRIAIGFTCTALLFGGYWTWLRSTRSTQARTIDACRYELDYPDRIGLDETIEIFVYQDCLTAKKHELAVERVLSSLGTPVVSTDCTESSASCTTMVKTVAGKQAHDLYKVRLRVDGQPVMSAAVDKDRFAAIRAIGEKSVPAISFIPLILALIVSFHREVKKYVGQLFGRDGGPSPTVQPEGPPDVPKV
jgi:tRNA A-37 threonylcarbamoyl transferase component Bud32